MLRIFWMSCMAVTQRAPTANATTPRPGVVVRYARTVMATMFRANSSATMPRGPRALADSFVLAMWASPSSPSSLVCHTITSLVMIPIRHPKNP